MVVSLMQFDAMANGLNSGLSFYTFWPVNKAPPSLGFNYIFLTIRFYKSVHWSIFTSGIY